MRRTPFRAQRSPSPSPSEFRFVLAILLVTLAFGGACNLFIPQDPKATPRLDPTTPPDPNPNPEPPGDPSPVSDTLTRAPYLQALTQTSVLIAFRTAIAMQPTVDYGPTLDYGTSTRAALGTVHAIQLNGLTPGRRYYYRVRSDAETLAEGSDFFFETDAGRNDAAFSFFVTGDVGQPGGEQATTGERVRLTQPRSELGLVCGDVIYPDGEAQGYDENLMTPWAPIMRNLVVMPALGNHDWHVDPDMNFTEQWYLPNNEHYYSFDRGNAHFVALDTREGNIWDRDNQVAWLRADLEANQDATWTFVYYHHPGYTCTYKGFEDAVIENFHPVFDDYAVDVVFMGHAHTYERLYPMRGPNPVNQDQDPHYVDADGTLYIVTGCGAKLNSSATQDCALNAFFMDQTISFTHVQVDDNRLTIRQIESATGDVRDLVTLTKTAP